MNINSLTSNTHYLMSIYYIIMLIIIIAVVALEASSTFSLESLRKPSLTLHFESVQQEKMKMLGPIHFYGGGVKK